MIMMNVGLQNLIMNGTNSLINIEHDIVDVFMKESFAGW